MSADQRDEQDHYLRGLKWFTNLGDVETCNCGNPWPCVGEVLDLRDALNPDEQEEIMARPEGADQ